MIGASESPAILGEGYGNESAWTVWQRKMRMLPPEDNEDESLEWGREIQPVVLRMFTKRTGIEVEDLGPFTIQRHPDYPWLGATLDGLAKTCDGPAVVEAKNVGSYKAGDWNGDEPPLRVAIQIQHQMLAAGVDIGFATACIGGNKLAWRRVEKNERFQKALIDVLKGFWDCVLSKTPPPVDGSHATARAIAAMWPEDSGATVVLPPESADWDRQLTDAKEAIKAAEAKKLAAENLIKAAIGEASFGDLIGGGSYSWKQQSRKEMIVKASTFRVLRRK
jgi:putative phage-type endonuclease